MAELVGPISPLEWGLLAAYAVLVVVYVVLVFRLSRRRPAPPPPAGEAAAPEAAEEIEEAVAPEAAEEIEEAVAPEAAEEILEAAAPPPIPAVEEAPPAAEVPRPLREGLAKTRKGLVARLNEILFAKKELDQDVLNGLEELLFTADIGVKTAQKLFGVARERLGRKELADPAAVRAAMRAEIERMLDVAAPRLDIERAKPFCIMVLGVNGVGKTTTIGKLASMYVASGKSVVLAAGDTFRAAAVEQLAIWGERAGAPVISGKDGTDPGAVIFDAVASARSLGADVVIADTAGRLHTKIPLMEELKKVRRVMNKAQAGAPHEVFLILDATNGQNAISQARQFHEALGVSGIILTKLDGTAKGGVIVGICDELMVPVRYIGVGERIDDLRPFDPREFVQALFAED